ncbi:MAG: hypothetical protein KAY24_17035 [Candidatus Eisenbacteria sp.]|nr:hypothetical protein [Candidatus Eisenbacteria bacterium]
MTARVMATMRSGAILATGLAVFCCGCPGTSWATSWALERAMAEADSFLAQTAVLSIPDSLVLATDVTDPLLAFFVGLLDQELYGAITDTHMTRAVEQSRRKSRIPYEVILEVRRGPGLRHKSGWLKIRFTEPLKAPVPYSILGYHPGSVVSSQDVTFEEWQADKVFVPNPYDEGPDTFELTNLTLWGVIEGEILIDIDGWVDAFLGGKLDDTHIVALALFHFGGEQLAMSMGFSNEGRGRSGALDIKTDKIHFPSSNALKAIGRYLRGRVVRRLARRGIAAWTAPDEKS